MRELSRFHSMNIEAIATYLNYVTQLPTLIPHSVRTKREETEKVLDALLDTGSLISSLSATREAVFFCCSVVVVVVVV